MSNVNMQNLFGLLILVSLAQSIMSEWDFITEQRETTETENNFEETQAETVITTAMTVDNEKFDDYELKKLFVENFKLHKHWERDGYTNEPPKTSLQRKARGLSNTSVSEFGMECLSCFANGTKASDKRCYKGESLPLKICADAEYCFTEVHPLYLRRGCILPGRLNRTFVCKCPLCNDKSSTEYFHYEYEKISDWAYDNARLDAKMIGIDLICKVCETKGADQYLDQQCRSGKNSDYMVCAHDQLCYTNIDDEADFVSRGCINKPAYNSIYYFCNSSACNSARFLYPKLRVEQEVLKFREPKKDYVKRSLTAKSSQDSIIYMVDLSLFALEIIADFYNNFLH